MPMFNPCDKQAKNIKNKDSSGKAQHQIYIKVILICSPEPFYWSFLLWLVTHSQFSLENLDIWILELEQDLDENGVLS